jgi:hypothetical protein
MCEHGFLPRHFATEFQNARIAGSSVGSGDQCVRPQLGGDPCDAPDQKILHHVRRLDEGGILGRLVANTAGIPGWVEILYQGLQAERVAGVGKAIIDGVDTPNHIIVDCRSNGIGVSRLVRWQKRTNGSCTVNLPHEASRTELNAIICAGRCAALMVVEPPFGGVMNGTDIPNEIGSGDQPWVARAG